ncbi:MAG TPA: neutral/alkaline non-lysosomal ceramidase N-terminal domain-containing protein [Bryobacteraceae bacterium]|nr:neutral/alkaline non-lysosomal ceramidase N-terminal domain-containing protein [Bryobacteraceae bacterium]
MLRILLLIVCLLPAAAAPQANEFRAGAAKIDITPPLAPPLPMAGYPGREDGHKAIHDNLYVRAIAFADGSHKAAIVTADLVGLSTAFCARLSERVARESGVAPEYLMIAGTHTHGGPSLSREGDKNEARRAYTARVEDAMAGAVGQALANLRPARMGFGAGTARLNMNRRALSGDGTWWLGFNPEGFSDKTVGVVKIVSLEGEPIAILMNYGMHGTSMGQENQAITADHPGATSRYVEQHYKDQAVAVWTSGAAGDQAPLYDRSPVRFNGVLSTGRVVGNEVIRVAETIKPSAGHRLGGMNRVVTCPGRRPAPGASKTTGWSFVDSNPVEIRLSLLMVGNVALAGVSGEVFSIIGQHTKEASSAPATMMITHCNGSSGYVPDDAAYEQISYEIQVTRLKPGCAEKTIVSNLAEMVQSLRR